MAKISISIPDELKEQLDTYAADNGFKRSEAVARMVTAYLEGQTESVSATKFARLEAQLGKVCGYLEDLHATDPKRYPRPKWLPKPPRSFIRSRRT